ncbi:MAG: HEAT repeat domain-containing protein [Acidobacteriota bacterium]|nr:HEAT repeat domain-containing protein [Acidobacteriota bacterium]
MGKTKPVSMKSLVYLTCQAALFGLGTAYAYVAAYTLFILQFGPGGLPWLFLIAGLLMPPFFSGMHRLQRRRTLTVYVTVTAGLFTVLYLVCLIMDWTPWRSANSFLLMILVILGMQSGSVILGVQAGRLFDARTLRRRFSLVSAGLASGAVIGYLSAGPLTGIIGASGLLFPAFICLVGNLVVLRLTIVRFRRRMGGSAGRVEVEHKTSLKRLLRKPYIASLFIYQTLSCTASQLIVYLFVLLLSQRLEDEIGLAVFLGNFAAARQLLTIAFITTVSASLLSRLGLGFGFISKPGSALVILGIMTLLCLTTTPADSLLFWLIVLAFTLDTMLYKGICGPAQKTAFLALPDGDRQTVETGIETIGIPAAYTLAGLILLVVDARSITIVLGAALLVILLWGAAGIHAFRNYKSTLRYNLTRRNLGKIELTVLDSETRAVIDDMLANAGPFQVRLALDLLTAAGSRTLSGVLTTLLRREDSAIRMEALRRIGDKGQVGALGAVKELIGREWDPEVKGEALRVMCALRGSAAVKDVVPYLDHKEPDLRLGALAGLLQFGGIAGMMEAGSRLVNLEKSPDPQQRAFYARVIGTVGSENFYEPLIPLLSDSNTEVRKAALIAAGKLGHGQLAAPIAANLADPATRPDATEALIACGSAGLPVVQAALQGFGNDDKPTLRRLLRICGRIRDDRTMGLLRRHLSHADRQIRGDVMQALAHIGFRAAEKEIEEPLKENLGDVATLLQIKRDLDDGAGFQPLQDALDDELAEAHNRVFLLLSFFHDSRTVLKARERLWRGSADQRAFALEVLDMTLAGRWKGMITKSMDENLNPEQRIKALSVDGGSTALDSLTRLRAMIDGTEYRVMDWTRACAIYAAAKSGRSDLSNIIKDCRGESDPTIRETAKWALSIL